MSAYDLSGKVVLITGAARGIGLATARAVHERGASVAMLDLHPETTPRPAPHVGSRALEISADVTDAASLERAVHATVEHFGGIDVAVANAGIAPTGRTARVYTSELFERVIDVNLLGVWRTINATLPHVIERRGQLVLLSSIYAFANGVFVTPYAVSKAGVEQMGRSLGVELVAHGVTTTVAYFGFVSTDMVRDAVDEDELGQRVLEMAPRPLRQRITPERAGESIVRAIERRAPRVVEPPQWRVLLALRGLLGPLIDARLARDEKLQALVREADVEDRLP